jgi:hypothetical protein
MSVFTKKNIGIAAVVLGIPALLAAWWLISPLFFDNEVNEEFPMSAGAEIPDDMTQEDVEEEMVEAAKSPDVEEEEPMPETTSDPVILQTGTFQDADEFHMGSGTATLYELDDGSKVLRLENFEVTNGPDLHVLLSTSNKPGESLGDYIDLGSLKGNLGEQNYEIPNDADADSFGSVVIYCQPFHVLFSFASLDQSAD